MSPPEIHCRATGAHRRERSFGAGTPRASAISPSDIIVDATPPKPRMQLNCDCGDPVQSW
jgi:hypothetical protein